MHRRLAEPDDHFRWCITVTCTDKDTLASEGEERRSDCSAASRTTSASWSFRCGSVATKCVIALSGGTSTSHSSVSASAPLNTGAASLCIGCTVTTQGIDIVRP